MCVRCLFDGMAEDTRDGEPTFAVKGGSTLLMSVAAYLKRTGLSAPSIGLVTFTSFVGAKGTNILPLFLLR